METLKTHETSKWKWAKFLATIALFSALSANNNSFANTENFGNDTQNIEYTITEQPKDSIRTYNDGSIWIWKFDPETWNIVKWEYITANKDTYKWVFDPNIQWGLIKWTKEIYGSNFWFWKIWKDEFFHSWDIVQTWKFDPNCWFLVDWTVKIWWSTYAQIKWWQYDKNWKLTHWSITYKDGHKESGDFDTLTWKLSSGKIVWMEGSNIKMKRIKDVKYDVNTGKIISWKIENENWSEEWIFDLETWKLVEWTRTNWNATVIDNGIFDIETWVLLKGTRIQNGASIDFDLESLWDGKFKWKIQWQDGSFLEWTFKWLRLVEWTSFSIYNFTKIGKFENDNLVEWTKIYYDWSIEEGKFKIVDMWSWANEILWDWTKTSKKWKEIIVKNGKSVKENNLGK